MTIATGNAALAADVAAIRTLATSASTAALVATANAATALSNSVAAQAVAAEAEATAAVALSVPALPLATSVAASNIVPIGQGGATVAVTLATLLGGETIDVLAGAGAPSDTDTFMVGQGSNVLVRQTMSAVWTYLQSKLPDYKVPAQEITSSKTLDATYNGQILAVTGAGVTLTPNFLLMGSGFQCEIVTAGSGTVIWGAGITATDGGTGLSTANAYAKLIAFTSSAGSMVLACVRSASGGGVAAPGPITGLTPGAIASSSLALSWMAPTTGGAVATYSLQYSVHGANTWTTVSPAPTTTSATVSGLLASTYYDFQVAGVTGGGVIGSYDQLLGVLTAAAPAYAPNSPASVAIGTVTSASVALNWSAPATDGTHSAATSYLVAYSSNVGSTWSTPVNVGNVMTYSFTGLSAATAYAFEVAATNAAGSSAYVTANATTSAASGSGVPNVVTALAAGTVTGNTVPLSWTAPVVDGSHGAATAFAVQYRISGSAIWLTATSAATASPYPVTGLISGQTYQFNVFGTNASGTGAGSIVTGIPTASGDGLLYWGTGGYPASSIVHGSAGNALVMYLTSGTNVASAQFGWSLTQYDPPTAFQALTIYNSTLYGTLNGNGPATAGSYYGWMMFYDTAGDCILAVPAATGQTEQNGTAITPLVTVT